MKIINYLLVLFSILLTISGCKNDDDEYQPEPVFSKTVLIYMAADNNLSRYAYQNIETLMKSSLDNLKDGKLLIYYDPISSKPELIEIYQEKNQIKRKLIKAYEEQNSASDKVLSKVIEDAFALYKSDSRGLILWSHATSWLPSSGKGLTRSFGQDGTDEMELFELKKALPDNFFDFIIFDACLMSSIEVCFELRDKAQYILASPSEIFAEGFPYGLIIKDLFSDKTVEEQLKLISESFFSFYSSQKEYYYSASVSLVKTERLNELALLCKRILKDRMGEIANLNTNDIQALHYLNQNTKILFDFQDFFNHLSITEADQHYLNNLLTDIVIHKKYTDRAFSSTAENYIIPISKSSGLSIYIPSNRYINLNNWYYTNTEWGSYVYE